MSVHLSIGAFVVRCPHRIGRIGIRIPQADMVPRIGDEILTACGNKTIVRSVSWDYCTNPVEVQVELSAIDYELWEADHLRDGGDPSLEEFWGQLKSHWRVNSYDLSPTT